MDMDTTRKKGSYEAILESFAKKEADILIGTQMIVKGHDFPAVTLVGVLLADLSLHASDYMAAERTFQLLTQAVGRAGRGNMPGSAVIQTYQPEHYAVRSASAQNYEAFYELEIALRKVQNCPPFADLVQITFTGDDIVSLWTLVIDQIRANAQLMETINANVEIEGGMTAEEALEQVKAELAAIPEVIRDDIVLEMYLDEQGEPVYATATIVGTVQQSTSSGATVTGKIGGSGSSQETGAAAETVTMDMNYARLTLNDVVTHTANVIAKDAADTMTMTVNVIDGDGHNEVRVDMGDGETSFAVNVTNDRVVAENAETGATVVNFVITDPEMSLDLNLKVDEKSQKSGADATAQYDVSLCLGEQELVGMTVNAQTVAPAGAADVSNAIRLAEVSDEDFQAWFVDVANGLQGWAVTVVQALPASVLMLLMGQ